MWGPAARRQAAHHSHAPIQKSSRHSCHTFLMLGSRFSVLGSVDLVHILPLLLH
jgi:hypothetical protein